MQFKHPEILYALFLLLVPIIVHLFQLRKFKKVEFTNVAFLKEVTIKTRKSSQIKKWLILITRLFLLAAIIIAFAQPFTSKLNTLNKLSDTIIYLDNSFSMQAKGDKGELLKRAVQDLISNVPENKTITLLTNDDIYKNTSIKAITNDLLQVDYTATELPLKAVLLKINSQLKQTNNNHRNIVLISDFQEDNVRSDLAMDSLSKITMVKLEPVNINNIAIDSAYISKNTATNLELSVRLRNTGEAVENLPISLYNDDKLISKSSVSVENTIETTFSIPNNTEINGKIVIDDGGLQFDNSLFFNINETNKINVLIINNANDSFLRRIYSKDEFNLTSFLPVQLNYNIIPNQKLIVLNELDQIPNTLSSSLKSFMADGGSVLVIPSDKINIKTYNAFLNQYNLNVTDLVSSEKRITTINYAHPIYNIGVFEKQVDNFQYPKVNTYYPINSGNVSNILQFENGSSFLSNSNNLFVFSGALNSENSNFQNSPLIVPTLYNIGRFSLKIPEIYFTIGKQNSFDIPAQLQQDDILSLVNGDTNIIPMQQQYNTKVVIKTLESPTLSGTYNVVSKDRNFLNVSYNYSRNESNLSYQKPSEGDHVAIEDSIKKVFDDIKSDTKINELWKWFVIFALLFLITEMLILKYFK